MKQSALLWQLGHVSLGCQPGRFESAPFVKERSLGRRPSGCSLTAWVQHLLRD